MLEGREKSDKADGPSTAACAKPRAVPVSSARAIPTTLDPSDSPPPGELPSPAVIAEAAEVEALLDEWTRGPPTPPAENLRRTIKRARSTSDPRNSPTP